jgi:hypothetical protein
MTEEPPDGHPLCCSWHATGHDECSCWHEEVLTLITRIRIDPGPDPNEQVEPAQLPCDDDTAEAS